MGDIDAQAKRGLLLSRENATGYQAARTLQQAPWR